MFNQLSMKTILFENEKVAQSLWLFLFFAYFYFPPSIEYPEVFARVKYTVNVANLIALVIQIIKWTISFVPILLLN